MEFGVFDHLDNRDGAFIETIYQERLKLIVEYENSGITHYHLAEHHATPLGLSPSPSVFLAAISQLTKNMKFGPMVYCLPLYDPLRLISEICMLDQLSKGRFEFGIGRGISPYEVAFFNIDIDNTLADKFTVNDNYALEAFGIYLTLSPEITDLSLNHTATIKIHADENNSPGDILGEWVIDVSTGYYHNLFVGDGCITLEGGFDYWISAHVDYAHTELIWLYTQYPFYTYSQTYDDGASWTVPDYGLAGAARSCRALHRFKST